jgi:hypothetical protein
VWGKQEYSPVLLLLMCVSCVAGKFLPNRCPAVTEEYTLPIIYIVGVHMRTIGKRFMNHVVETVLSAMMHITNFIKIDSGRPPLLSSG